MEKIYNDKFFDLVTRRCHDTECREMDLIHGIKNILNRFNESSQYDFILTDYERSIDSVDRSLINCEDPIISYRVIWGDTAFNLEYHNNAKYDEKTRFIFTYGVECSDIVLMTNYIIEANIVIINDDTKKFDVQWCREIYEDIHDFLIEHFNRPEFAKGVCDYGIKPSYVIEAEAREKARKEAECRAAEEEDRKMKEAEEERRIQKEAEAAGWLAVKEAELRKAADGCYNPQANYANEGPVRDDDDDGWKTPEIVAIEKPKGNLFDGS